MPAHTLHHKAEVRYLGDKEGLAGFLKYEYPAPMIHRIMPPIPEKKLRTGLSLHVCASYCKTAVTCSLQCSSRASYMTSALLKDRLCCVLFCVSAATILYQSATLGYIFRIITPVHLGPFRLFKVYL